MAFDDLGRRFPLWPRVASLSDLLVPVACPGCGRPGPAPCRRCLRELWATPPALLHPDPRSPFPVVAAGGFEGPLRRLVLAHKERRRSGLVGPLGDLLAEAVVVACDTAVASLTGAAMQAGATGPVVLVPIPSRRAAVRSRGDDTVARLAGAAAHALRRAGIPTTVVRCLRHGRAVRDQSGLNAQQRRRNLDGALILRPGIAVPERPALVVVVDDVTTTGASLAEAFRVLRRGEVQVIAAATVAATRRRTEVPIPGAERLALTEGGPPHLVRSRHRH